ncbi:MAG: T9SS type A sorting domain-containing protein [Bacteroidia bacterium]|nr:T9SS type A sorting domain-containing protein [Bacteroidia bacterium]
MFGEVTLSTANYDALLTGWAAQTVQSGVTFSGGNSKYSAGAAATARGVLTDSPNNWTITDGGLNVLSAVKNNTNLSLSMYPNPAKDFIHINGITGNAMLTITDLNGLICLTKEIVANTDIYVSQLAKGIYLLNIENNGVNSHLKLVKQ